MHVCACICVCVCVYVHVCVYICVCVCDWVWAEPQATCDLCKDYGEDKGQRSEPQTICDLCNNLRSEDKGQGPEPQIPIHSGSLADNATIHGIKYCKLQNA